MSVSHKVIINPKALLKKLKPFGKVIIATAVMPILESLHFLIKEQIATIAGTDLETCMVVEYKVEHAQGEEFSFIVDYKMLIGFLSDCEDAPAVFEYTPSAEMLYIKQEDFRLRLRSDDPVNYVKLPVVNEVHCMTMDTKEFLPVLSCAVRFSSNDDLRPAMTGVCIHDNPQRGLTVVSTDAHMLYWKSVSSKTPETMKGTQFIIPSRSIHAMAECIKGKQFTLIHGEVNSSIESDEYKVYFRHIDARYPDYEVLLKMPEVFFFLKRKQLAAFLKLALHFVNKSTNQIIFGVEKESIKTQGGDVDFDFEFSYKVPIYNSSKPDMAFYFALNGKMLTKAIGTVKDEYVKVHTSMKETGAFLIDECVLVMPLMLNH